MENCEQGLIEVLTVTPSANCTFGAEKEKWNKHPVKRRADGKAAARHLERSQRVLAWRRGTALPGIQGVQNKSSHQKLTTHLLVA